MISSGGTDPKTPGTDRQDKRAEGQKISQLIILFGGREEKLAEIHEQPVPPCWKKAVRFLRGVRQPLVNQCCTKVTKFLLSTFPALE